MSETPTLFDMDWKNGGYSIRKRESDEKVEHMPTPGKWFVKECNTGIGVYVKRDDELYSGDRQICFIHFSPYGKGEAAKRSKEQKMRDAEFIAYARNSLEEKR